MLQSHFPESSLTVIERPRCPQCQIRMMLVRVEPSLAGPDLGTFACPKCGLAYKALAEDPMNLWPTSTLENGRSGAHIRRMTRERYIARCIQHWHVVRIDTDGKETVMEITDSEEAAKAEVAKLDREAERTYQAEQNLPRKSRNE